MTLLCVMPVGELLDLVGQIYDCAVDPALWPVVLQRVAGAVSGSFAAISLHDATRHSVLLKAHWNVDPSFEQSMTEHFAINPLVPSIYYHEVDEPYTGMDILGSDSYLSSQWYRNAVAPHAMGDTLITLLAKRGGRFGALSLFKESRSGPFTESDVETLKLLAPHVRRAALIADLLEVKTLERATMSATLDLINAGVVLTEESGKIVHANKAARRLLDDGVLFGGGGQLTARDPHSASELRAAIASAGSGTTADVPRTGISVVAKASDGRDLAIWVLPLDGGLRHDLGASFAAAVAVFIRELGDTSPFPAELFVRRYGITPAECRLLVFLTQGLTLADAADALGISMATARTHLARLLAKTETQSQADLMRLAISALAPASG